MKKLLLLALVSLLALAVVSAQDWPMTNYDNAMSRHSPQTVIGKDNVNLLQVKWILNTNNTIENPPLIIGNTGYLQTSAIMQVIAFDLNTGLTKWKFTPYIPTIVKLPRSTSSHGMTYENGIIYAPTGAAGTIVALEANTGKKIWESQPLRPLGGAFRISAPPVIWNNYVIAGSALGDLPPFGFPERGSVTGLDKMTGKKLWEFNVGAQVAIGGPSIGNGVLLVPTGGIQTTNAGGYIVAFGLPGNMTGTGNMTQNMTSTTAAGMTRM